MLAKLIFPLALCVIVIADCSEYSYFSACNLAPLGGVCCFELLFLGSFDAEFTGVSRVLPSVYEPHLFLHAGDAYKLDVLSSGNRRREFYDVACEEHEGPHNPLDISGCEHFICNDGTQQPIEPGTPCKKVVSLINHDHS